MSPAKKQLTENAKNVYEYLVTVKEATKERILRDTAISVETYLAIRTELISKGLVCGRKGRSGGLALLKHKKRIETAPKGKLGELSEEARKLLNAIPDDGRFVTNLSLRYKLRRHGFSTEDFWKYRKELLDQELIRIGRGRGGSVARILVKQRMPIKRRVKEDRLYEELRKWLQSNRVAEVRQGGGQAWVAITAKPRKYRRRSGLWSRPDVTLVEVIPYEYLPNEVVVTTFEVKSVHTPGDVSSSWVFEAASHSKRAHESYLVVGIAEDGANEEPPDQIVRDLRAFGIGFGWLYYSSQTNQYEFNIVWDPDRRNPLSREEDELLQVFAAKLKKVEVTPFKNALHVR